MYRFNEGWIRWENNLRTCRAKNIKMQLFNS